MSRDATFEDGREAPLRLFAADAKDLEVIAALSQDAVFPVGEMKWEPGARRFSLLLNRFRWEDADAARRRDRAYERVRSVLTFNDVSRVASQGIDRSDPDVILSLLAISFVPGDAPGGRIELTLAGDGAISLEVECIDMLLADVTRPYAAPSGKAPHHPQ